MNDFGPIMGDSNRYAALRAEIVALESERARVEGAGRQALAGQADVERQASARMQELQRSIAALEEQAEFQSMGVYRLRYDFQNSAQYEARLEQMRERQKEMMKAGQAAVCDTKWTVDGNARAGEKMVKDQMKLMLRAFNGECRRSRDASPLQQRLHA